MDKEVLMGKSLDELKEVARQLGMPAFTGGQIAKWLYEACVCSIDEMTNISKANREKLSEHYCIGNMPHINCQKSVDGTIKYLFPVNCTDSLNPNPSTLNPQQRFVETVFIPDKDRATLCVSCQVGCKMNCLFCQTGKQGFEGSLTAADIINQIYSLPERERLTNIVFMGQGEPMDNLDNVLRATEILTSKWGFAWSPRRITVSSVGIRGKLKRFLDESECHVAISLHSPIHEQRSELMPAERGMAIEETVALLHNYFPRRSKSHEPFTPNSETRNQKPETRNQKPETRNQKPETRNESQESHQRRLSFEYIVFDGQNDTQTHAREIVRLLSSLDCRVNLIRFHQIPDVPLHTSDEKRMETLRDYLTAHGIFTTIRASRGQDIYAACGLLSTKEIEKSNPHPSTLNPQPCSVLRSSAPELIEPSKPFEALA